MRRLPIDASGRREEDGPRSCRAGRFDRRRLPDDTDGSLRRHEIYSAALAVRSIGLYHSTQNQDLYAAVILIIDVSARSRAGDHLDGAATSAVGPNVLLALVNGDVAVDLKQDAPAVASKVDAIGAHGGALTNLDVLSTAKLNLAAG